MKRLTFLMLFVAVIACEANAGTKSRWAGTFIFGSYGRVGVGSNLRGGQGQQSQIVSHGPRLLEGPYLELDLGWQQFINSQTVGFRTVITLAFGENLFHYNGRFDADIAIRNLFAESVGLLRDRLKIWVGSRMYRGDDLYLFDYWPLDNQNTIGGGVLYQSSNWHFAAQIGANRLDDAFRFQEIESATPPFGSSNVVFMERQQWSTSVKLSYFRPKTTKLLVKFSLYGQFSFLPAGTLKAKGEGVEHLPRDVGWVVGGQVGLWNFGATGSFVNLFFRAAGGLAAFGDLSVPFGLDSNKKTTSALELVAALSANFETKHVGIMTAAYARYFKDADANRVDLDDGWELAIAARPTIYLHKYFQLMFELSYQLKYPFGLDPRNGGRLFPQVFGAAIMPALAFSKGSFARPQFRIIYALSYLNRSARELYADDDPRRNQSLQHYLGVMVEWWFNSSYR